MQVGDISSIEFHKVLQEVEKYNKLKADIRYQDKTQKNSEKNYLHKEEKKTKKIFYKKLEILQIFRV